MLDDYKDSQSIAYKMISNQVNNNKISHAYIIETNSNPDGLNFAKSFAKVLLCPKKRTNLRDCGECRQCQTIDDNNFIELKIIEPSGQWITKDQIEELQNTFMKKAIVGNNKVYIINHAERMKANIMDKMLKFIEEPLEGIVAILITDNVNTIIDTIISRCQIISLRKQHQCFSANTVDNVKLLIDINKYSSIDINDEYLDKVIAFVEYYEHNHMKTILMTKGLVYDNFKDALNIELFFKIMILFYKDILDYKVNNGINIFKTYDEKMKNIAKSNSLNLLSDKISVIIECVKRIKYNANLNLLIDKLIIELEKRCENG